MSFQLPPIAKLAEQLLLDIEQAVRRFPRYHRYAAGADLRAKALHITTLVHRAWRDRRHQRALTEQLAEWRVEIEQFLRAELRLELKVDQRLQPLQQGIDFLGYIIRPTHTTVRRRVVGHARQAMQNWQTKNTQSSALHATPQALREIRNIWASYLGHFTHANTQRLRQSFHRRFPWLHSATIARRFSIKLEGRRVRIRYR